TSFAPLREFLGDISRSRAVQGFSPSETATFVFSLKQPLFDTINGDKGISPTQLAETTWTITRLLDQLGLYTFEAYQKGREEVIARQQREIAELSPDCRGTARRADARPTA
ncbi:MAG TPA: RsbRD N-terminal domain-containing protein, partial [Bradyrhizobium sp.]|nr:RsbRD N-terminal domain-containing protein [Bradyrhizobium sp.]